MKQSVRSSKIHKRAEVCYIFHNAFYNIAFVDPLEQRSLKLCLAFHQKLLPVADDPPSLRIELGNHKLNLLIRILAEVFLVRIGYQACRDKDPCLIHYDAQAAVQYLRYLCRQHFPILKSFFQSLAASLLGNPSVGQLNLSFSVIYFQNFYFHRIAHGDHGRQVRIGYIRIFIPGHDTIRLIADIQDDLIFFDVNDRTFYDFSCSDSF